MKKLKLSVETGQVQIDDFMAHGRVFVHLEVTGSLRWTPGFRQPLIHDHPMSAAMRVSSHMPTSAPANLSVCCGR